MSCPHCRHDNPDDAQFCGACGSAILVDRVCARCNRANPASQAFCHGCGNRLGDPPTAPERNPASYTPPHLAEKILQSRSALEGERKLVTVLFADVKGSMDLAAELDPEEWHQILDRFFRILTDGVHRFEGTVNQYTGDGIMALFGAPIAHEDHARRACYTALALREELSRHAAAVKREHGLGFSTRIGIHSGEVVVGKIGDDLRMDYTAQGQTVGLAQRMESLASPDTCYLSAETAGLVDGFFELEDLGEFRVKGVAGPLRVHQLAGAGEARTRFDVSRARGLTRFVGRDADMETLEAALAQAQAGNGQVVGIVADAGTGKSRLSFEFLERCRARGINVVQGNAVAHGKNVPYLPMLQVFRGYYGITDSDDDRAARQKIAGRLLLFGEEFRELLPLVFDFFGVPDPAQPAPPMDAEAAQKRLLSILRRLVQETDPGAPDEYAVTLIEDLHWLDPGSEAFLAEWVDAVGGSSSFLLVNFRPEYHAEWMQKSCYRQIPLAPLGPEAIRELLGDLIGEHPSTDGLATTIHTRTGGNPFFAEEIVQTLIEAGHLEGGRGAYRLTTPIEKLEVPPSVQGVLAARIDRLPERDKQVLQAASVIGREFSEPILLAAAELPEAQVRSALSALRRAELVYEAALYPVAEYIFKHALTQEVALGSQLKERRRKTHAAVAGAIEQANPAKLDEAAAVIAHHREEAGEALEAARWYQRAGVWVVRSDFGAAARHLERALALTEDLPFSPDRDALRFEACMRRLAFGWRVGITREDAERVFHEGCELAERIGDVEAGANLRSAYGVALGFRGDFRRFLELGLEAACLLDESADPELIAVNETGTVGYAAFLLGRLDEAERAFDRGIALTEGVPTMGFRLRGVSIWSNARHMRAHVAAVRGRIPEAKERLREPEEVSRARGFTETLGWALCARVEVAELAGETGPGAVEGAAFRVATETMECAEKIGSPFSIMHGWRILAIAHRMHGNFAAAREASLEALRVARDRGGVDRESDILSLLSAARLAEGDVAGARVAAEEGVASAEERGARFDEIGARIALARVLRATKPVDEAAIERSLARTLELVGETDARAFEPQVLEEQARLAALRGDEKAAAAGLARALELYHEIGATGHATRLEKEVA